MATIISSNSIDRDRIAALREQKKIAREVEAALEAKKQADIEEKKRIVIIGLPPRWRVSTAQSLQRLCK